MNQKQDSVDYDIKRVSNLRNQTFEEAYQVHDVGQMIFCDRLEQFNLQAFEHGDDKRDEDVYSGTGIDLGVQHQGQTIGWVEIKTKTSESWLGRLNKEDWQEYRGFATYVDEEVFVYFALVEDVDDARVSERYFVRVPPMGEEDIAVDLPFESKGHKIVEIADAHRLQWPDVVYSFLDELHD